MFAVELKERQQMDNPTTPGKHLNRHWQGGFTLLGLLFLLAVLGISLAVVGTLWSTVAKRDKERELLYIGNAYRQAIQSYWETPLPAGTVRRLPRELNELLLDARFPYPVRHLRRIYRDPMTGKPEWGLAKDPDGGIYGVHSLSMDQPMKTAGFSAENANLEGKTSYQDWVFTFKQKAK